MRVDQLKYSFNNEISEKGLQEMSLFREISSEPYNQHYGNSTTQCNVAICGIT